MDFNDFKQLLSRQRAVRSFDTEKPVDDALVGQMLEVATFAPSGGNRQPWSFVVIRDQETRNRLREIYDEQVRAYLGGPAQGQTPWSQVPVLIAVCTPKGPMMGGPSIFPAVQNLLLAAHALGLGSVLTTLWKSRESDVKEVLGVPEDIEIQAILPVGWPDRKYGRSQRRPVGEVAFRDRWGANW